MISCKNMVSTSGTERDASTVLTTHACRCSNRVRPNGSVVQCERGSPVAIRCSARLTGKRRAPSYHDMSRLTSASHSGCAAAAHYPGQDRYAA